MAETSVEPVDPERLAISGVLERGFSITFRHSVPFGCIALILTSASFAYNIAFQQIGVEFRGIEPLIGLLIQLLLSSLAVAAMVYGTIQALNGQTVRFGACFRNGIAALFPAFGAAFVFAILFFLGLVLLIVPSLIVATFLWVVIPIAVLERQGLFASIVRSVRLTKGNRWRVFAIVLFAAVFFLVIFFVLIIVMGTTARSGFMVLPGAVTVFIVVFAILSWLVGTYFTIFVSVLMTTTYHDLRIANEGGSVADIAAVFD